MTTLKSFIHSRRLIIARRSHQHDYQHSHLDLTQAHTPKIAHRQMRHEKPQRMNNILTSQTEPYDLDMSFSRSFQNLTHLPSNYELAAMSKADLSKYSSLHKLSRWSFITYTIMFV
ncbi:unnamed protein product [Oncorhynchus mykiss]|uniref:Uncharacterized protein n=1 Tax=Oncorhynchus mykiss TaxID=8022 RepID=A0A060X568_ONCMY|nr:unnamed protein product [Oncorhynchus mykiss]